MFKGFICAVLIALALPALAQVPEHSRINEVIYGRKHGMALTMDVFQPTAANGRGVIFVLSGGFYSNRNMANPGFIIEFLKRGYTVFAVGHGSQPRFTIPEGVEDMRRAVRFIKHHAAEYKVDGEKLGVMGASAGGHLSLMLGLMDATDAATPDRWLGTDQTQFRDHDEIDNLSSKVAAVACFYPPTDFLNYGTTRNVALGTGILKDFPEPFEFRRYDGETKRLLPITVEADLLKVGRQISPVYHASADDPPTLIIHGDADALVPIQQAQLVIDALKEKGATAELVTKPGGGHGWAGMDKDLLTLADWFDKHLRQ